MLEARPIQFGVLLTKRGVREKLEGADEVPAVLDLRIEEVLDGGEEPEGGAQREQRTDHAWKTLLRRPRFGRLRPTSNRVVSFRSAPVGVHCGQASGRQDHNARHENRQVPQGYEELRLRPTASTDQAESTERLPVDSLRHESDSDEDERRGPGDDVRAEEILLLE